MLGKSRLPPLWSEEMFPSTGVGNGAAGRAAGAPEMPPWLPLAILHCAVAFLRKMNTSCTYQVSIKHSATTHLIKQKLKGHRKKNTTEFGVQGTGSKEKQLLAMWGPLPGRNLKLGRVHSPLPRAKGFLFTPPPPSLQPGQ